MKTNIKIIHRIYSIILLIGLVSIITACDDNVPKKPGTEESENNTPANTIATREVKEIVLRNSSNVFVYINFQEHYRNCKDFVSVLYERFDFMICIGYHSGSFYMLPYERPNGEWITYNSYGCGGSGYCFSGDKFFFYDLGKMTGLSEISSKEVLPGSSFSCPWSFTISEKSGYVIVHKTEDESLQYIRLWLKSYSEDGSGTITSITVQYQTF